MEKIKDESKNEEIKMTEKGTKKNRARISPSALVGLIILTIFISSLFGAIFGFMTAGAMNIFAGKFGKKVEKLFPGAKTATNDPQESRQQVIIEDSAVIDVVEKSSPAVVSIIISKNISRNQNPFNNPFFNPFFGSPFEDKGQSQGEEKQTVGGGSGFFITSDGLILTNRHVIEDQQAEYTVMTNDGKEYQGKVLARDPVRDIAIVKVEGNNFPILSLADSDALKIGQTTIAIGNSLGEFSNSVSRGIVSGLKRNVNAGSGYGEMERLTDIIQTDAAINPGNSGGPLLNIDGQVIGINVARAQGAENVGFALPINQAKRIIDEVKNGVKVALPYLGVRYIVIDSAVQREAQLPFDYGVLVMRGNKMTDLAVIPGSPADKAGIAENDIILEINGQKINQNNQLGDEIAKQSVGDKVTLKIWHRGEIKDVQVKLEERKN